MRIFSRIKDYSVDMVDELLKKKEEVLSKRTFDKIYYFVDQRFFDCYKNLLKPFLGNDFYLCIEATEKNKEYTKLADYYRTLIESGFSRNDLLVTFGGGILQDISGFIASTLYRGIKWGFFPTTLLAQADSCIGSKTSINFENSKNLIGTFYPPDFIFIDISFCRTLTEEYFNSGLGEIIKFHLLADRSKFDYLKSILKSHDLRHDPILKEVVSSTLEIKKSYFDEDEFDTGRRNLLNYGHCYGHALESASQFRISHGEAVIVGMGFANLLSLKRGLLAQDIYEEIEVILQDHYPSFDLSQIRVTEIISYLKRDKKRVGRDLTMILARDFGNYIKVNDVKEEEIISTHEEFLRIYENSRCP